MTTTPSTELVRQTLLGQNAGRAVAGPLAVHYCAAVSGISIREYTLDARRLADAVIGYYRRFRPDAVWLSADTWVSAQAMGAGVAFPADNQPLCGDGEPAVRSIADIERIPLADPASQGRYPLMLQAMRYIKQAIGRETFIVACFDQYPFSLACALMGIQQVMTQLMDDRAMIEALMDKCAQYAVAYASALADAGADMLSGGDSPAGLIGPRLYREVALPYERRVISQLKSRCGSTPVSLHICGNATPILADMATSGADVLELDHQVEIATACRALGPNVGIWGNLDPVELLARGTPGQISRATKELLEVARKCGHGRLVVSSGCTLPPNTPAENLEAMIGAVREFR